MNTWNRAKQKQNLKRKPTMHC